MLTSLLTSYIVQMSQLTGVQIAMQGKSFYQQSQRIQILIIRNKEIRKEKKILTEFICGRAWICCKAADMLPELPWINWLNQQN